MKKPLPRKGYFERLSSRVVSFTGSNTAFFSAVAIVLLWAVTGPLFGYSDTWQLVINTGTTIITFLMVFLIQKSQNKDSMAIQLKLNELVAAHELASNRLVSVEEMSEDELRVLQKYYAVLARRAQRDESLQQSHSIEEASINIELKKRLEEKKVEEALKPNNTKPA